MKKLNKIILVFLSSIFMQHAQAGVGVWVGKGDGNNNMVSPSGELRIGGELATKTTQSDLIKRLNRQNISVESGIYNVNQLPTVPNLNSGIGTSGESIRDVLGKIKSTNGTIVVPPVATDASKVLFIQKEQSELVFDMVQPGEKAPQRYKQRPEEFVGQDVNVYEALKESYGTKTWAPVKGLSIRGQ